MNNFSLRRSDLVTSCFLSLSLMHLAAGSKEDLSSFEVAAFHSECNKLQNVDKRLSRSLTRLSGCSFLLFAKFDIKDCGMSISVII